MVLTTYIFGLHWANKTPSKTLGGVSLALGTKFVEGSLVGEVEKKEDMATERKKSFVGCFGGGELTSVFGSFSIIRHNKLVFACSCSLLKLDLFSYRRYRVLTCSQVATAGDWKVLLTPKTPPS